MKKILPIYLMSLVLLGLGIGFSLLSGMKSGEFFLFQDSFLHAREMSSFQWRDFLNEARQKMTLPLGHMLLQILLIFPVAAMMSAAMKKLKQPSVIGLILAGLILGPSLLGYWAPDFFHFIFPKEAMPRLEMLGTWGVLTFMFLAGMEMDLSTIRQQSYTVILISHIGIFLPFFLGIQAASFLFRSYATGSNYFPFAMMMGIGMSITAFPVLVRILQESGLMKLPIGQLAFSSAAVADVTAWLLFSVILAMVKAHSLNAVLGSVFSLTLFIFSVVMFFKPFFKKWIMQKNPSENHAAAALLFMMLLFAFFTEAIGIHAIFGAFIAGALVPKKSQLREHMIEKLEYFCMVFLLPVFFAVSGLRVHFDQLSRHDVPAMVVILLVAIVGKWGGSWAAARIAGLTNRDSMLMGALMNTRGLMELIVLNIAYETGIFSAKLFSMMVIMALVTTCMAGPLITYYKKRMDQDAALKALNV